MSLPVAECGYPVNLSSSGAISVGPCQLLGFYVNSTSSGTMNILDGGSSGTALCGTITPAIGFHRFPADIGRSGYFTKVSGTIDVTFFWASAN